MILCENVESILSNAKKVIPELENEELEAPEGVATSETYSQLLIAYLLQSDLSNAKLLWKRIPSSIKTSNPEIEKIWLIGQKLWVRDFPKIYQQIAETEWPESSKSMIDSLKEIVRSRAINLMSNAYSSLNLNDFSNFIGVPVDECKEAATELGWTVDQQSEMVYPVKSESTVPCIITPSDEQLAKLTDFVTFLEN